MSIWIHDIATMNPGVAYTQAYASEKMQSWIEDERLKRMVRMLYQKSGIDQRYSVIRQFDEGTPGDFFPLGADGRRRELSTAERNEIYTREAGPLAVELAKKALAENKTFNAADITHVITISCTGFYNPGPDYQIIRELGLPAATQRYHLGFMGCYAAFPGLKMAKQFCQADPDAVVLVMCLELCSIHLQLNERDDSMLANSLFADGAAVAIVSAREPANDRSAYRMGDFHSTLIPSGEADMAWTVGDLGFDIALSSYVPKIIGANIQEAVKAVLKAGHFTLEDIGTWAVHPGGKAIVENVVKSLGLDAAQVAASHQVLRQYGNMSSATVLFVLKEILEKESGQKQEEVCAMAFGPGLTVEMGLLEARRVAQADSRPESDRPLLAVAG